MAKKEEKKQPETTEELIPEETAEAPQEAPKAAEAPETNPFEEKYKRRVFTFAQTGRISLIMKGQAR